MNKEYAMQILNECECGTLEVDCSLARESFAYLTNLILKHKKIIQSDDDLLNRIYYLKYRKP